MSNTANAALANLWKDLWNGHLEVTDQIIAEDFVAHAAPLTGTGGDEIRGRNALNEWVAGIHAILPDLTFVIQVGPITDDEHMVVRWKAQGTYRGGFPNAPSEAIGRTITFTGTDTLRIAHGMLAEYWANADSLLFFQQLGVREVPGAVSVI
jgi:SnoaL-like polyketide cyclase